MKRVFLLFFFSAVLGSMALAESAPAKKENVLVFVHGAWAGGWQSKRLEPLLEAQGVRLLRPSLPGMGEHYLTTSPAIGLGTHVDDIVNYILFEDLHDIVLVGHSYGGMVITGVAERIPDRIRKLIYLDAILPENGESVVQLLGNSFGSTDGMIIPTWPRAYSPAPFDVPQPLKTFTDSLALQSPAARRIPAVYILTVDEGKKPEDDAFFKFAERARARGWPVVTMSADHVPQWRKPEQLAPLLLEQMR